HRLPPRLADIPEHEHAEWAVVIGRAEAAVDLGRRKHEPAPLAQVHHLLHRVGCHPGEVTGGHSPFGPTYDVPSVGSVLASASLDYSVVPSERSRRSRWCSMAAVA